MKKMILFCVIAMSALPAFAGISVDCPPNYGPNANNMAAIYDEDAPSHLLRVGYESMGQFFEFRMSGCAAMSVSGIRLLCDGQVIGSVGKARLPDDDAIYSGPRSQIRIDSSKYDLTGSCRDDRYPLTLLIKK